MSRWAISPGKWATSKAHTNISKSWRVCQPDDYVPYLAMGDMYSQARDFPQAQANYEKAYRLGPDNPLIIAGAMNAALESHETATAKHWLDRANKAQLYEP